MIEAAGGVVWRNTSRGRIEVLLVHRPRAGDWSLPKGKLAAFEAPLAAALREVFEETGLVCEAGVQLPSTNYLDRKRRHKRVRYWAMTPLAGEFRPNAEVDAVAWVRHDRAAARLSAPRDLPVVEALAELLVPAR